MPLLRGIPVSLSVEAVGEKRALGDGPLPVLEVPMSERVERILSAVAVGLCCCGGLYAVGYIAWLRFRE